MDQFVVSARKYRPDTFDSVVGQQAITTTLKNAIRSGHIAQSFLFCGPRGVGKTTCARILAKTINCMNPTSEMEACGECESCKGFQNNASQNIYELDAASNRSVESMRTLIEQVRIPPQIGKYKVYIIDEVHMLTTEAFNAFLKTLEEPPPYAKFILATTERNKILPTILSRCQISDFKRINTEDMVGHLQKIAIKEGVTAEEEGLRIIAQKADGGLRDALSMFDQMVSFSNAEVSYSQVISLLNILDYDYYFRFTEAFLTGQHPEILTLFNQILERGFDSQNFVNGLNLHFRQLLLAQDMQTLPLLELSPSLQKRYGEQGKKCTPLQLLDAMGLCARCDLEYRASNNKRLLVEILLLQICAAFGVNPVFPNVVFPKMEVEGKPSKETTDSAPSIQEKVSSTASLASISIPTVSEKPSLSSDRKTPLSIKGLQQNIVLQTQAKQRLPSENEECKKPDFTSLAEKWGVFVQQQSSRPALYDILKHTQIRGEENILGLRVGNTYQAQSLEEYKQEIGSYFRDVYNCHSITLEIKVDEQAKVEVMVYTAQKKYQKMCIQNPELQNFKEKLKLDMEL